MRDSLGFLLQIVYRSTNELALVFLSWVGYEHHDFQGQQFVLERGEYPHWDSYCGNLAYHVERFMSFRPIFCAVSISVFHAFWSESLHTVLRVFNYNL